MTLHIKKFNELTIDELYDIMKLRNEVFVVEQTCIYQDLDGLDKGALHVWFENEDGIQAYLRVMDRGVNHANVSIGRVLTRKRKMGLGTKLLREGIRAGREFYGEGPIYLEAQTYARGLYEKQGFRQISEEFLEDGIPHIAMQLD